MCPTYYPDLKPVACPNKTKAKSSDTGAWVLPKDYAYLFDKGLADGVLGLMDHNATVIEFGAGRGCYSHYYHDSKKVSLVAGYDGATNIAELTDGFITTLNLIEPHDVAQGRAIDWVVCFEVAEHIPPEHEGVFIDNLLQASPGHLLLSWRIPRQGGVGHVNLRTNDYVIDLMRSKGYSFNESAAQQLRGQATYKWFKNTIMVFHR